MDGGMDHEFFMRMALAQAEQACHLGEVPIGAVIVTKTGEVIGFGCNQREHWKDPTAHAELIAIRDAARVLGDWRLYGCRLYVTVEPCMMCAGAIQLSRIERVIFGVRNEKGGCVGSLANVFEFPGLNHYPKVSSGILADECGMIIQDFFQNKRRNQFR